MGNFTNTFVSITTTPREEPNSIVTKPSARKVGDLAEPRHQYTHTEADMIQREESSKKKGHRKNQSNAEVFA